MRKESGPEDNCSIHQLMERLSLYLPLKLERDLIPRKTHRVLPPGREGCRVGGPLCPLPAKGGMAAREAKGSRVSRAQTAGTSKAGLQLWGFELDAGGRLRG